MGMVGDRKLSMNDESDANIFANIEAIPPRINQK